MIRPVIRIYGDRALLVVVDSVGSAHRVASAVESASVDQDRGADVVGVVVGMGSVVVLLARPDGPGRALTSWVESVVQRAVAGGDGSGAGGDTSSRSGERPVVQIPVDFDGPDLEEVARAAGTDRAGVVGLLAGVDLHVAFLGFAPGFPYLVGLPPPLAAIRRRATPRPSVPAGSVAIGGGFASIYPRSTPGGWMLVGTTTVALFDPDRPPYALVRPGDTVRFVRRTPGTGPGAPDRSTEPAPTPGGGDPGGGRARRPGLRSRGQRSALVVEAGLVSMVQDEGRRRVSGLGVPAAGAADPDALVLANRLVGNPDGAAIIEVTARGPTLRFAADAHIAVVGASSGAVEVELDGRPCPDSAVVPVGQGQVLTLGRVGSGFRATLAVAGGFETPPLMGSRSSDLLSGLGPGPLLAGDQLELGAPVRPHGALVEAVAALRSDRPREVRILPGPYEGGQAWPALLEGRWRVSGSSNRIGVRLAGDRGPLPTPADGVTSTGTVTGAIQLPPDGLPIILGPDHATVGGYPVIGCVISADLSVVGQLAPGDEVTFVAVNLAAAGAAWEERARTLDGRVRGWFPTAAGT